MNKIVLTTLAAFAGTLVFAQTQIGNGDMEQWETVATGQEPVNWNSFLSAGGSLSGFASDQCESSTDVRPGSAGSLSCRIFSISTFSIVANGNLTLGQVNMGSVTPAAPENYNVTLAGNPDHSEAITDHPDSLVFWVKFTPAGATGTARVKGTLHTDYNYRDPEDAAASNEVIAIAEVNYPPTNGWQRFSVPFQYTGPACITDQAYLLITFTTNMTPGGGTAGDEVLIDDVELVYNSNNADRDYDGDGITDNDEATDGTNPCDFCDFDIASATVAPSPEWEAADCDQDGMSNGWELANGGDPLVAGLSELNGNAVSVAMNNAKDVIVVKTSGDMNGTYEVLNLMGQVIQSGAVAEEIPFQQAAGMYVVRVIIGANPYSFEILCD